MSPRPTIDHIRKPQILRAASEVITERGLVATRIADVAARAGTSAPAVLYCFSNREELLHEALIADEGAFQESLDKRLEQLPDSTARLQELIVESATDGDLSLWIELWARSLHDERSREARQRLDDNWRRRIALVIEEGLGSGEFERAVEPHEAAVALASLMDALATQVTLKDASVTCERMIEICFGFADWLLGARLSEPGGDGKRHPLALQRGGK